MSLDTKKRLENLGADTGEKKTPEKSAANPEQISASGGGTAPQLSAEDINSSVGQAVAAAHARNTTVLASAEYAGREAQANLLLSDPRLSAYSAEDIIGILASAPVAQDSAESDSAAVGVETPVYDKNGKAVMGADGKPMTYQAEANTALPVYDKNGKAVMGADGKPMTYQAEANTETPVYDKNGKPVMGADGKQLMASTVSNSGTTQHQFDAVMNQDEPVGAAGGNPKVNNLSTAGLDAEQSKNVLEMLGADVGLNDPDGLLSEPEPLPVFGKTTHIPLAEAGGQKSVQIQ